LQIELWEDERMACLERLGKIDAVYENILADVDGNEMTMWDASHFNSPHNQVGVSTTLSLLKDLS
jgi:hypothetical protein